MIIVSPMSSSLQAQAAKLPRQPGCYLFRDPRGRVLYVGKAIDLRARVKQYIQGHDERTMVPFLVDAASDVECVVTSSEKEALILENTLIKKHRPRFNTKLRDDSNFLHLRIDPRKPWARYTLVRRIHNDGARYFGPYHSASRARQTLAQLQRSFPLRTCTDAVLKSRQRPCLLHQMHRCVAPCVEGKTTTQAYDELIDESMLLLKGRNKALVKRLRERMFAAAESERFEQAARLRDLISDIEATLEQQQMVDSRLEDRDIWGVFREGDRGGLAVLPVREGMVGQPRTTPFEGLLGTDSEILSSLLNATYREGAFIPPEILLPQLPDDHEVLAEVLTERLGKKVRIHSPQRGAKVRMVELAQDNARVCYEQSTSDAERRTRALRDLADAIGLDRLPHRIDCFDNSNIQGQFPVAAMSVFIGGQPDRQEYRRYRIKTVVGADDFASMAEVVGRRLKRGSDEGTLPDLIVVDGGRGQLNAALGARDALGMDVPIIGISKPRTEHARGDRHATDKLVLPHHAEPLHLPEGHPGLRIVQHLRDEVHNHAIRYHRKVRRKDALTSVLDGVPGIGKARRQALLKELGSARAVAEADPDQLAAVSGIGPAMAHTIYEAFHPENELEDDEII